MKNEHSIARLCQVLGGSKSGYYDWQKRQLQPGGRAEEDRVLREQIKAICQASRHTYGSPRVRAQLRKAGRRHGRNRIARLMKEQGAPSSWNSFIGEPSQRANKLALKSSTTSKPFTIASAPTARWATSAQLTSNSKTINPMTQSLSPSFQSNPTFKNAGRAVDIRDVVPTVFVGDAETRNPSKQTAPASHQGSWRIVILH
jgi:hypothetical protein